MLTTNNTSLKIPIKNATIMLPFLFAKMMIKKVEI